MSLEFDSSGRIVDPGKRGARARGREDHEDPTWEAVVRRLEEKEEEA